MIRIPTLIYRAAVLFGAIALYISQGASGLLFGLLLFAPDLSMVGYQINPRLGSWI